MSPTGRIDWRGSASWIGYLAVTGLLSALYLFAAAALGQRPADQLARPVRGRDRRRDPDAPAAGAAAWWLFAAGSSSSSAATSTRTAIRSYFGADVPFPSIGDALYLLVYPVLMAGLLMLVRRRNPRATGPR